MGGGGTGWLGGDAAGTDVVTRNDATSEIIGVAANPRASVRSTPGPATNANASEQQLLQVAVRRASDHSCDDALLVPFAAGAFDPDEP